MWYVYTYRRSLQSQKRSARTSCPPLSRLAAFDYTLWSGTVGLTCKWKCMDAQPYKHLRKIYVNINSVYLNVLKLPSHIPRDLTASLLRPCYDQDAAQSTWTQQGRSEVVARNPRMHKVADRRRIFWTCTKQSQKLCILAESWLGRRGIAMESP